MDDSDRATEREELIRNTALQHHKTQLEAEREHLARLAGSSDERRCRCCEEELHNDELYCDVECRKLHEEIRKAERRNNG